MRTVTPQEECVSTGTGLEEEICTLGQGMGERPQFPRVQSSSLSYRLQRGLKSPRPLSQEEY